MQSSPFCSGLGFCWSCSTPGTLPSSKGTKLKDDSLCLLKAGTRGVLSGATEDAPGCVRGERGS